MPTYHDLIPITRFYHHYYFLFITACIIILSSSSNAFQQSGRLLALHPNIQARSSPLTTTTVLYGTPVGPLARARKAMDPDEYNRIVEEKMKQDGLTKSEAETEYNNFLENPPAYYALEKREKYYKKLGYKSTREGRIGEAEKEGRGDAVRAEIEAIEQEGSIKAFSVLGVFVALFLYLRTKFYAGEFP